MLHILKVEKYKYLFYFSYSESYCTSFKNVVNIFTLRIIHRFYDSFQRCRFKYNCFYFIDTMYFVTREKYSFFIFSTFYSVVFFMNIKNNASNTAAYLLND